MGRHFRSFAIFPCLWLSFEEMFKSLGMDDDARDAVFHQSGNDGNDVYYLLSTTLLYEFIFETVLVPTPRARTPPPPAPPATHCASCTSFDHSSTADPPDVFCGVYHG